MEDSVKEDRDVVRGSGDSMIFDPMKDRHCWVCFATDEDDAAASWVQPCNCKGTSKWVHQMCLQRWVDEKQKGNPVGKVSCPQCNTEYLIVYPEMGPVIVILDSINTVIYRVCPFIAAGVMVGSIYWVAVTYGAVTVMQVMGQEQGLELMERANPVLLLVGLPTVPVALVLGKMVKWEDTALSFLRRNASKMPLFKYLLPSFTYPSGDARPEAGADWIPALSDPGCVSRVLCSALALPAMSVLTGNLLLSSVTGNTRRALLGGILFLAVKGVLKIYHKQQHYIRQCQRKILDHPGNASRGDIRPPAQQNPRTPQHSQ